MSWTYQAPVADMRFVMDRVLQAPSNWTRWPAHQAMDIDTAVAVLEEASRFAADRL